MIAFYESKQEVTTDFYYREYWNDPRLSYNNSLFRDGMSGIFLHDDTVKNLWSPDTFFVNEKKSFIHITINKNTYTKLSPNGDVFKSDRFSVTSYCPMNFNYFPFDSQVCVISIESCKYGQKHRLFSFLFF